MSNELSELAKRVLAHLIGIQARVHKIMELAPDVVAVQYDFMEDDDFVLYFDSNIFYFVSNKVKVVKCTANLWVSVDIFYSRTFPRLGGSWLAIASARLAGEGVPVDWHSAPKEVEIPLGIRAPQ